MEAAGDAASVSSDAAQPWLRPLVALALCPHLSIVGQESYPVFSSELAF